MLFIVPLLAIVSVFSFYPIITSFIYTGFDYRTNDPQHAKIFLQKSFNESLFKEDGGYIVFYLNDEITVVGPETVGEIKSLQQYINGFIGQYEGKATDVSITSKEEEKAKSFINVVKERLNNIYSSNPDAKFYNKDKMPVLLNQMQHCFIEPNYVGLDNYSKLIHDSRFWRTLVTTIFFTLVSVAIELALGMMLALIMNRAMRGIGLIRTVSLIPWAIPTAVSALIWSYLYDGSNGIVSNIFAQIGLVPDSQSMLLSANGAMWSAILADIWKTTPYMALLLLAGLKTIDQGLYESASIDGSGAVNAYFRITLPLMKPAILVALLFRMLDAFRVYDLLAILTGGGPGGATETLSIYAYKLMISQGNFGYGATIVVAMFICVGAIAFFFVKVLGTEVISNEGVD